MLKTFRGRWAAAGVIFACPGAALACTHGSRSAESLHWEASDFAWPRHRATPADPFIAFSATFISPQLPGQFATPVLAAAEGEPGEGDTGFRASLDPFWSVETFPSQLDGARVDITGESGEIEGCSEAIFDFEQAVAAARARWLNLPVDEDAEQPAANVLPPPQFPEDRLALAGEAWKLAEPSGDLAATQRWMNAAAAEIASLRPVITSRGPRPIVFTGAFRKTDSKFPIEFDALDPPRSTTVERLWPERPTLMTLAVTYRPSGCRGYSYPVETLVHRFPLALMASEP